VQVRERRWVVAEVDTSKLSRAAANGRNGAQHLITLRSVEDDAEPDESIQVARAGRARVRARWPPLPDRPR